MTSDCIRDAGGCASCVESPSALVQSRARRAWAWGAARAWGQGL